MCTSFCSGRKESTSNRQGNLCFSVIWLKIKEQCVLWMLSSRRMLVPAASCLWASVCAGLGELAYSNLHPSLQLLQITLHVIYGIHSRLLADAAVMSFGQTSDQTHVPNCIFPSLIV